MKRYTVELSDDLSRIYEDIAGMHQKKTEECLAIILERVIRTMLRQPRSPEGNGTGYGPETSRR